MMKTKTALKTLLPAIVVLALGWWIYSRFDVWFGNRPEPAYTASESPHRILLTFGTADELSRNVSWQCDSVLRPSCLLLADTLRRDTLKIEATGEVFCSRSGVAAYYVARLRTLKPDTYYSYQVRTGSQASEWYHFRTFNGATADNYSFLYSGDVQDTIGGKANELLQTAWKANADAEFTVFGGDLTERPMDKFWAETFRGLDSIGQQHPVLNVTGNHEYLKNLVRSLERRYSLVFSYFLDSMVGENQVYTLRYNDMQLFLLDSNREFPYLWTQKKWLEEALRSSTARWKIVVLHHPIYSIKGTWNNLVQRLMFGSLIEDYGVDLVLQGHEHAYARMTNHDADGQPTTPVYTVSHCSPKTYRIDFSDRFDRFGISDRFYQKVHVHGDTLTMTTYTTPDNQVYDAVDIIKQGSAVQLIDRGSNIPERLDFTPRPGKKKDLRYQKKIEDYKARKVKKENS